MIIIIKGLLFSSLLIIASITDIKRREIDNFIPVSILVISLIGYGGSFSGAMITALPFFIPAIGKDNSIGGGDVKIMFACGALLGIGGGFLQTVIALPLALLFSLGIVIKKRYNPPGNRETLKPEKRIVIPLAPFLCVGGILSYIITNMGGI
ncbi:MAG: A24 family peptidase [Lachnospiraceae bacterium]|nr:A24 family peptidase [Lachnospiraceae bacterium]